MMLNPTCYRALNQAAREIRLLLLSPGSRDTTISCSLIYVSLNKSDTVPYEALSYCWGDPRDPEEISVCSNPNNVEGPKEQRMSITSNLHDALKCFRPRTGPGRLVWIDAICVNQADLTERSSQVSLMRDIYCNASQVLVWLGKGDAKTHMFIHQINNINERYQKLGRRDLVKDDLISLHNPVMEDAVSIHDFIDDWPLFEMTWFRRTWVVQEIFNAKTAIVFCGQDILTWPMVLRVNQCILLAGAKANSAYKVLMPPIYDDFFRNRVVVKEKTSWSTKIGILEILVKGLDLDATDPRDKIFAMLQFGEETQDLNPLPPELLTDYHKSVVDVFADFTKWWIVEHQSLRILSAIQALEGRTWQETTWRRASRFPQDHPSWSWWYRGQSNWAIGLLGISIDCPYRAAADTKPDVSKIAKCKNPSILPLIGIRVGTIDVIKSYPYYLSPAKYELLHKAYVGIFDPLNYTGKWCNQMGSKNTLSYVDFDDPVIKNRHFSVHPEFSTDSGAVKCHSECFFETGKGSVGLCPFSSHPGDLVVVFCGGQVPYVVRELISPEIEGCGSIRKYTIIGECFAEGYMEGQAIQQQRNPAQFETFCLI